MLNLPDIQRRLAAGEEAALQELYDAYSPRLYQFAYAIVRTREPAEEIVADVFARIWEKRASLPEIESFAYYLHTATRNTSISYLRKRGKIRQVSLDALESPAFRIEISPEDILISREVAERINAAVGKLPPQCRLIFRLVKEEGLKYREVADLLNVSTKTVENQVGIALKKIHAAVEVRLKEILRRG